MGDSFGATTKGTVGGGFCTLFWDDEAQLIIGGVKTDNEILKRINAAPSGCRRNRKPSCGSTPPPPAASIRTRTGPLKLLPANQTGRFQDGSAVEPHNIRETCDG